MCAMEQGNKTAYQIYRLSLENHISSIALLFIKLTPSLKTDYCIYLWGAVSAEIVFLCIFIVVCIINIYQPLPAPEAFSRVIWQDILVHSHKKCRLNNLINQGSYFHYVCIHVRLVLHTLACVHDIVLLMCSDAQSADYSSKGWPIHSGDKCKWLHPA